MRRRLLVGPLALVVLACFTSTAFALSGSFRATISGKATPFNARWEVRFVSPTKMNVLRNGRRVSVVKVAARGNRLTLTDLSGSYACTGSQKTGTYTYAYQPASKRLTFTVVADRCSGRKVVLTSKPFAKA